VRGRGGTDFYDLSHSLCIHAVRDSVCHLEKNTVNVVKFQLLLDISLTILGLFVVVGLRLSLIRPKLSKRQFHGNQFLRVPNTVKPDHWG
jgi:hypothetical protein